MSNDPDTQVYISGNTIYIRTGTRTRSIVVPGLAASGIGSQYPDFHYYDSADVAVQAGPYGPSGDTVWRNLKEDSAPNFMLGRKDTPVTNGSTSSVPVLGKVYHYVNDSENVVVNMTDPAHLLAPGIVIRLLDEVNGQWVVTTVGFGNGALGWFNELTSDSLWGRNAEAIGRESVFEQTRGRRTRISLFTYTDTPLVDPASLPPSYKVIRDRQGSYHLVDEASKTTIDISRAPGDLGRLVGSALGNYLVGDQGAAAEIAANTVLGSIGQSLGDLIALNGSPIDLSQSFEAVFNNFDQTLFNNLKSAGIGSLTAFTSMELGRALGLDGFGAELFNVVSGAGLQPIYSHVLDNILNGTSPFADFNVSEVFGANATVGSVVGPAIGSFFGAKLGSLVISPTTSAGAALASLGSSVGAYVLGAGATAIGGIAAGIANALGNVLAPGVGAFVGYVLGALIGRLFGKRKPRVPSATADITLNAYAGQYQLGSVVAQNGGNVEFVRSMARTAVDTVNGLIQASAGAPRAKLASSSPMVSQSYGHLGNQVRARLNGGAWQNFTNTNDAVEWGALSAIRQTKVVGGELFIKRAISRSTADNLTSLLGDIQVAADYSTYARNRTVINEMIASAPRSTFSAAWITTLGRAAELGINRASSSDFYGGLRGFNESFGFGVAQNDGARGYAFEAIEVSIESNALRIATNDGSAPFEELAGTNNWSSSIAGRSAYIADYATAIGYVPWTGQATAGNDIWVATGGGPVTMDDTGTQYYGYWDPYYGYYQYPVTVSGGDDIFVGSSYSDALYGRSGWDWLDAGAGDDLVDGGEDDDVLLGRGGNDRLLGGSGNDYIAAGDGDDYFFDAGRTWGLYGGDGDDILVGGAGMDSPYGENGDDLFIIDQDGGGTWDALNGQAGSDTISYERFTSGVYIDFAALGGWSWDPTAKYIYGDAISGMENVTGSQFADTIYGDGGTNVLSGLAGVDYLAGRDGDDILEGGRGADILDGGNGTDTASYSHSATGVLVDLAGGVLFSGDAEGDALYSIENITGSNFADEITGNVGNNILAGLDGDDVFVVSDGNDIVDGGEGRDTLDASGSSVALTVYEDSGYYDPYYGYTPGAGLVAYIGSAVANLSSIEQYVGSSYADYIAGTAADEWIEGGAGNDQLYGGAGSDTYIFGRGDGQDSAADSAADANSISLTAGIDWRDVAIAGAAYSQQGGSLVVSIRGTSDQIAVGGNFSYVNSGTNAGNHNHAIKTIDIEGLSQIDVSAIDWTPYAADDNATVVYGAQNRADLIFAYAGDDVIYTAGNSYNYETRGNVVYAGDGNDTVYASYGDDQYIFERGNGADTLFDNGGADTVVIGPSVVADDVIYEVVNTYGSSGDYGSSADLYIGLRDINNPTLSASQVADRIRIVGGGTKSVGVNYGTETLNTVEYVRVGGQEIDLTKANINWTVSYYYDGGSYYPIALDLDGDGIELRSVEGSRIASVETDGTITRIGWLGQDDGFLALDRDGNGVIDRIGEISFVGDLAGAKTDLEGLAAYDSNADGKLDALDKRWGEFKIWQDKNQDGFGSKSELVNLNEAGVSSISLKGQLTGFTTADGPDNTVISTTDVVWKDATRTGSAYDVALARLQVRTDDAAKGLAYLDAKAGGKKSDDIEPKLRGIQTLTPEQAAAIKDKKSKQVDDGSGGQFYRVETLLGNGSAKVKDGLYTIDPKVAKLAADTGRKLSVLDQFTDSDWTKLGSTKLGEADMRGADAPFKPAELTKAQQAAINDARKIVADRKVADEAKGAERAAKDAADAIMRPAPTPPSAQELERLKRNDKFKLLEGVADTAKETKGSQTQQMTATALTDSTPRMTASEDSASTAVEESETERQQVPEPAETRQRPNNAETAPQGSASEEQSVETDVYGVVIRAANARLVQALASFGDAPAMMANYQGLNAANDAQAGWLSVDAMPSVQRLASIR